MDEVLTNVADMTKNVAKKWELAKKYMQANTTPSQDLCPEIIQYWDSSEGNVQYNSMTGERRVGRVEKITTCYYERTPANEYVAFYARYLKELNAIELAIVVTNGNRGKAGEPKKWEYHHGWYIYRALMFKGDTNTYHDSKVIVGRKYYNKDLIDHIGYVMNKPHNRDAIYEEFKRLIPGFVCTDWQGKPDKSPWLWSVREAYKKQFIPRNSKKSDVTDMLNIVLLERMVGRKTKMVKERRWDGTNYDIEKDVYPIVLEKVNDDVFCLRIWGGTYHDMMQESSRIYIPSKGKLVIAQYRAGRWSRTTTQTSNIHFGGYWSRQYYYVVNEDEFDNCNRIKYVKELIDWTMDDGLRMFIDMCRHPIVEKLMKMGQENLAKHMLNGCEGYSYGSSGCSVPAALKNYFGVEKEKDIAPMKLLGVNKHVLNKVKDLDNPMTSIREVKKLFGIDISTLSKETLDEVDALFDKSFFTSVASVTNLCGRYYNRYTDTLEPLPEDKRQMVMHALRVYKKSGNDIQVLTLMKDTANYVRLAEDEDIDINDWRTKEELQAIHDNLVEISAIRRANGTADWSEKTFEKLQPKREEKFEELGEEFSVITPKGAEDLIKEGAHLHHCVGGYLRRHSSGDTNIIFLRRTDKLDESFYTIEVDNNDHVVQVHGSHNKWLGNDPDAIPFVYRYFKSRGFDFDNQLLLNLGAGYSRSHECLPESYLTAGVA